MLPHLRAAQTRRKTKTGTLSRSTRLGQHSRQNCGEQKRDALGNGRETATHAMAQQYSSTRDGTNTSEKYNTPDQDTPAEHLSLLPTRGYGDERVQPSTVAYQCVSSNSMPSSSSFAPSWALKSPSTSTAKQRRTVCQTLQHHQEFSTHVLLKTRMLQMQHTIRQKTKHITTCS